MFFAGFPSCRLIFVIFGFWGFMMVYSLRVNISVPVVAMSNKTYVKNHSTVSISEEDKCEGGNKTKKKETFVSCIKINTVISVMLL